MSFSFSNNTKSINLLSPQESSALSKACLFFPYKQDKLDLLSNTIRYLMKKCIVSEFRGRVAVF